MGVRKGAITRACEDDQELHAWIERHLGLSIPRASVCPHHDAPFEYIRHSYRDAGDVVVWAPRGGGKTTLGAVMTLLDVLHKPGCQVRILGGSLMQSMHMWDAFVPRLEEVARRHLARGGRSRRVKLKSGSMASVLTQSQRAVRGQRVQKLRCDEVEMFDPAVWDAAQLATRSLPPDECRRGHVYPSGRGVPATIEAMSTLHAPYGLMQQIVDGASEAGRRVIRWCLLDVLERCPADRPCDSCLLKKECGGRAKNAGGFITIDDAERMKRRVSRDIWDSEMLCLRPSRKGAVFAEFDGKKHVSEVDWWSMVGGEAKGRMLAMDFGFQDPFVCLWILWDDSGRVYVLDEYVQKEVTLEKHIQAIRRRSWGGFAQVACDSAGNARNDHTAISSVQMLRDAGYRVSTRKTSIDEGLDAIRAGLEAASGEIRLRIHPRCRELVRSMVGYHYDAGSPDKPHKDHVHDHCIDALRYFYANRPASQGMSGRI